MNRLVRARIHIVVILGIAGVLISLFFIFFSGSGPQVAAVQFMSALGQGDADTLAKLTYDPDRSEAELNEQWQDSVKNAQYYRFKWRITGVSRPEDDVAIVVLAVIRNPGASGYDEFFEIKLQKVEGKWKVALSSLSRDMYPWLPQVGA